MSPWSRPKGQHVNWWVPLPQAECMEAVTHPTAPGVRDLEEERLRGDARRADWGSPLSQSALTHVEDLSLPLILGLDLREEARESAFYKLPR